MEKHAKTAVRQSFNAAIVDNSTFEPAVLQLERNEDAK